MSSNANAADTRTRIPLAVLVLGAVSLVLLIGSYWIRERLVAVDLVRLGALADSQLAAATVHLWLEELVSGDAVNVSEITEGLERSGDLCRTILLGGFVDDIDVELPPLDDPALGVAAESTRERLAVFVSLSEARQSGLRRGENVGIGSAMDVEYDRVFDEFLSASRALEDAIRIRLVRNSALSRRLFVTMVLAWAIVIGLFVAGLWRRERRRLKAVALLAQSEMQLAQAQKMDAVGRLAGGITHDINNYLAAITTNCELVQMQTEPDSPIGRKMTAITTVVGKASSLIDRLLAFSRQQPAQSAVVDLNDVIAGMEPMLRRLIGADVRLTIRSHPQLWAIRLEPSQVEQVLVNLLVNAKQAMPGGGAIAIETDNATLDHAYAGSHGPIDPGEYASLVVSDTGPGVPAEIRDKIFEPFFTTRDDTRNSGLGLATVYGIVKQNRGQIWVYSESGRGAVFRIYLPRVRDELTAQSAAPAAPGRVEGGAETILLAEDNDEFRESIQALLTKLGYRVVAASDGQQALEAFVARRDEIDLVITDVIMPRLGGAGLVEGIRQLGDGTPVIFISGYTDTALGDDGAAGLGAPLLQKPISADRLAAKIREVLDDRFAGAGDRQSGIQEP